MPHTNTRSRDPGFRRVAIDGHFLDEVKTRLQIDPGSKTLSYVSAPVERHRVAEDEEGITLTLPAITALQLFHDGVLAADTRKSVAISIAARPLSPAHGIATHPPVHSRLGCAGGPRFLSGRSL